MVDVFQLAHSNDETQVLYAGFANSSAKPAVSRASLVADFDSLLAGFAVDPCSSTIANKKTAPQFLRRFHSKTCNDTLFSLIFTQNLRPSLLLVICPFPTNTAKPATHPTKSAIDSGSIWPSIPAAKTAKLANNSYDKTCKTTDVSFAALQC